MNHQRYAYDPNMTIFATGATFAAQVADYVSGSETTHPVGITDADRFFHTYIVGRTGSGKSTLLATLLQQDLERGHLSLIHI